MLKPFLLLWLGLSSLCLAPALAGPQEWPFGMDPGDSRARSRDLFNLGILGAKSTDAIRGEPQPGTGLQRFEGAGETGPDRGPAKKATEIVLRVERDGERGVLKLAVPPPRSAPANPGPTTSRCWVRSC